MAGRRAAQTDVDHTQLGACLHCHAFIIIIISFCFCFYLFPSSRFFIAVTSWGSLTLPKVPFAKWTDEPFSLWLFSLAYAEAAKAAYQAIGISTQQCRFNRFSESLEAIACATVATDANITGAVLLSL